MKTISSLLFALCFILLAGIQASAQVNLPYTLNFTSNDATAWADGIVSDGDGGTSNINGLDIEIFATTSGFSFLPGSTMGWHDNDYYVSADNAFTGITPGPDLDVTDNGVPAIVLRSTNPATNFSLVSFRLYDWGVVVTVNIEAFNNGVSLGVVQVDLNSDEWTPELISQSGALTPSIFQSVDEVRIYPDGASAIWPALNAISLAEPSGTLPVQWISFTGSLSSDNTAVLNWQTSNEENNLRYAVEHSSNGSGYSEVGTVSAASQPSELNSYQYSVAGLAPGQHYFRIRQVDADGRFSYSRIITLNAGQASRIAVYPNPVQGITTVSAGGSNIQQLFVYSVNGKLVARFQPRTTQAVVDLGKYPGGIYFIEVVTAEGTFRQRVLKK